MNRLNITEIVIGLIAELILFPLFIETIWFGLLYKEPMSGQQWKDRLRKRIYVLNLCKTLLYGFSMYQVSMSILQASTLDDERTCSIYIKALATGYCATQQWVYTFLFLKVTITRVFSSLKLPELALFGGVIVGLPIFIITVGVYSTGSVDNSLHSCIMVAPSELDWTMLSIDIVANIGFLYLFIAALLEHISGKESARMRAALTRNLIGCALVVCSNLSTLLVNGIGNHNKIVFLQHFSPAVSNINLVIVGLVVRHTSSPRERADQQATASSHRTHTTDSYMEARTPHETAKLTLSDSNTGGDKFFPAESSGSSHTIHPEVAENGVQLFNPFKAMSSSSPTQSDPPSPVPTAASIEAQADGTSSRDDIREETREEVQREEMQREETRVEETREEIRELPSPSIGEDKEKDSVIIAA